MKLEGYVLAGEFGGVEMRRSRLFDEDNGWLLTRRLVPEAGKGGDGHVAVASTQPLCIPTPEPADTTVPSRTVGYTRVVRLQLRLEGEIARRRPGGI